MIYRGYSTSYREGLSLTSVRDLWTRVLWSGSDSEIQDLSEIQERLSVHHIALKELSASLLYAVTFVDHRKAIGAPDCTERVID